MFLDSANHNLISDVNWDKCLLGSHEISLTYQCIISLYIQFRYKKGIKTNKPIKDQQKKHRFVTVNKNNVLEVLNMFLTAPTSPLFLMWIETKSCLVRMKYP